MKLIFITATFSIIWYMRRHRVVSQTYSKEEDTFKIVYLIAPAALLALLVNHELSLMEVRACGTGFGARGVRLTRARRGAGTLDVLHLPGGGGHPASAGACASAAAQAPLALTFAAAGDAAELGERGQFDGALRFLLGVRGQQAGQSLRREV
jgi:hypothetical protein